MHSYSLAPKFFEFLSLEHTNNNVHNVRLCLTLAASDAVPVRSLWELSAGRKVAAVLAYAHDNAVEPFMEPALGRDVQPALIGRHYVTERDSAPVQYNGIV